MNKEDLENTDHDKLITLCVKMDYLVKEIDRIKKDIDDSKKSNINHVNDLFDALAKAEASTKLSSKDRAAIVISFISALASIVIAVIHNI